MSLKISERHKRAMNKKTLEKLGYYSVLSIVSRYASSHNGKEYILGLNPSTNIRVVRKMLEQSQEAFLFLSYSSSAPVGSFPSVKEHLERATRGASLSPHALLEVLSLINASQASKSDIKGCKIIDTLPYMRQSGEDINLLPSIQSDIRRSVDPEGEINDNASSDLKYIRRRLFTLNQQIRADLEKTIRSQSLQKYIQEPIVTTRSGRFVIPVKSEFRSMIPGIIHDQSSTGMTVYIEPQSVVNAGPAIRSLEVEEKKEIERILKVLSAQVAAEALSLSENEAILTRLDVLFAKAKYARDNDCTLPELRDKAVVSIKAGKHPLIDKRVCIPLDVSIGEEYRTLIVTGPNTGGKTVSLKTVGLLVLMCQTGIFVPAAEASFGVFKQVLCDIGDEQSIEQSLSTFSAHISNIISILNSLEDPSLVLFDELGAGTDPVEGAALARAIIMTLHTHNAVTIATTHYSELKVFAFETEGIENASMEFNAETLMPTYRLITGIPGKSNALEISKRLGLSEDIIKLAQTNINSDELKVNKMIADIEYNNHIARVDREKAEALLKEAQMKSDHWDNQLKQISQKREAEIEKGKKEAERIIAQAQEEVKSIIKEIRFLSGEVSGKEKNATLDNAKNRLSTMSKDIRKNDKPVQKPVSPEIDIASLRPGADVFVKSINQNAVFLQIISPNEVQIQAGILKMKVSKNDIAPPTGEAIKKKPERRRLEIRQSDISISKDLRGMLADEAVDQTDRYIDSAVLAGINEVTLIHGKGTGALRSAIHVFLNGDPRVESYRLGKQGEGDAGVTVVKLK
ncbi:MAG: endonuclease MutS2 [Clostridiales bacterium]|nr:endonuclease MutS2 [Clostridiales bacterium]